MTNAEKIVDSLLEDEDEKPKKKLPAWLAKIKGEDAGEDEPSEKKDDDAAPKSEGGGGGSKSGSSTTVGKTW
jgi:hypothetical protein